MKALFYKRFADDFINRWKKNKSDSLPTSLINYHPNINFTVEVNPQKLRNTNIKTVDGKAEMSV